MNIDLCPECDGRLTKARASYGNTVIECKDCGYAEEAPDRTIPKKPKLKVVKRGT